MRKRINKQEQGQRREAAVNANKVGKLRALFSRPEINRTQENLSAQAWQFIHKAEQIIQRKEIEDLEILLLKYIDAVKRAQGCKCPQCRKRAKILTELLDDELTRLTHCFSDEAQDQRVEQRIIESDTHRAIQILKEKKAKQMRQQFEKREKEWLKRSKRIRQLIEKVVEHNNEPDKGLTVAERQEIQDLLAAARERRKDWEWKKW